MDEWVGGHTINKNLPKKKPQRYKQAGIKANSLKSLTWIMQQYMRHRQHNIHCLF